MIVDNDLTKLEILIADGSKEDAQKSLEVVNKCNHAGKIITSGIEVVEMVYRYPFDIILMEINLQEIDGFQVTESIRTFPEGRGNLPIIALADTRNPEDVRRCFNAGMNNFILKPLTDSSFISAISLYAFKKSRVSS